MNEISIYPIVPASGKSLWFLVPVLLMLAAVAGLLIYLMFSTKQTRFEVSPQGLRIRGDIYGRLISKEHLLPEEAVALYLVKDVDWRPKWRTNGAALPGYQSGWFRVRYAARPPLPQPIQSQPIHPEEFPACFHSSSGA